MNANESAVIITTGEPVTITSVAVNVEVGWDHIDHNGDWYWHVMVDGSAIGDPCRTENIDTGTSPRSLNCTKTLSTYVNTGSTISIRSYWNGTNSFRDQVQDNVTWTIGYSISSPGTGG